MSAPTGLTRAHPVEDQIAAIHRKIETLSSSASNSHVPSPQAPPNPQQGVSHPPSFPPPPFHGAPFNGFQPPPREMFAPPPLHYYPGITNFHPGGGEQDTKRFKPDDPMSMLIPERQWINMHPTPYSVQVAVPTDPQHPEWNLKGQTLRLESLLASTTLQQVKDKIADLLQFPASKQKLTVHPAHPHLGPQIGKNTLTLAAYNIPPNSTLELAIKERGGKK